MSSAINNVLAFPYSFARASQGAFNYSSPASSLQSDIEAKIAQIRNTSKPGSSITVQYRYTPASNGQLRIADALVTAQEAGTKTQNTGTLLDEGLSPYAAQPPLPSFAALKGQPIALSPADEAEVFGTRHETSQAANAYEYLTTEKATNTIENTNNAETIAMHPAHFAASSLYNEIGNKETPGGLLDFSA